MIVIGVDPHKHSHSAAAVNRATAELVGERTVRARAAGFGELWEWAQGFESVRVWALEDVRNLSGGLERFLLAAGERVVRVSPKLMASQRKAARQYGKSDTIDALAVARAAIREPDLPEARGAGPEREIALLSDHRMRWSPMRRGSRGGCAGCCTISIRRWSRRAAASPRWR